MTDDDLALLHEYAAGREGIVREDQLAGATREPVAEFTGRDDVWSPRRAAVALLDAIDR